MSRAKPATNTRGGRRFRPLFRSLSWGSKIGKDPETSVSGGRRSFSIGDSEALPTSDYEKTSCKATCRFCYIGHLGDDLVLHILSFVSYAPYERLPPPLCSGSHADIRLRENFSNLKKEKKVAGKKKSKGISAGGGNRLKYSDFNAFGTLTHVLPLVCRRFHRLCRSSDMLWNKALSRLICLEPDIWAAELAILHNELLSSCSSEEPIEENKKGSDDTELRLDFFAKQLILNVIRSLQDDKLRQNGPFDHMHFPTSSKNCRVEPSPAYQLFQLISLRSKPITLSGPLFYARSPNIPTRDSIINLRMSEPMWITLVADIMRGRSAWEKGGTPIVSGPKPRPTFLYSCGQDHMENNSYSHTAEGDLAIVVEVSRCNISKGGTAHLAVTVTSGTPLVITTMLRPSTGTNKKPYAMAAVRSKPRLYTGLKSGWWHHFQRFHPSSSSLVMPEWAAVSSSSSSKSSFLTLSDPRRRIFPFSSELFDGTVLRPHSETWLSFPPMNTSQQQFIKDLMSSQSELDLNGFPIRTVANSILSDTTTTKAPLAKDIEIFQRRNRPMFVLGSSSMNISSLANEEEVMAPLVEIRRCVMQMDGSADFSIVLVANVLLIRVLCKDDEYGLYDAEIRV